MDINSKLYLVPENNDRRLTIRYRNYQRISSSQSCRDNSNSTYNTMSANKNSLISLSSILDSEDVPTSTINVITDNIRLLERQHLLKSTGNNSNPPDQLIVINNKLSSPSGKPIHWSKTLYILIMIMRDMEDAGENCKFYKKGRLAGRPNGKLIQKFIDTLDVKKQNGELISCKYVHEMLANGLDFLDDPDNNWEKILRSIKEKNFLVGESNNPSFIAIEMSLPAYIRRVTAPNRDLLRDILSGKLCLDYIIYIINIYINIYIYIYIIYICNFQLIYFNHKQFL